MLYDSEYTCICMYIVYKSDFINNLFKFPIIGRYLDILLLDNVITQ